MMPEKRLVAPLLVAIALVVGVIGGWQIAGDSDGSNRDSGSAKGATTDASGPASWLFSHTAGQGEIRTAAIGSLELVLRDLDAHVTAFTDRPYREARIETVAWLVDSWDALFTDDPPNAVLVEHDADGETESVVVTLLTPVLADDELRFVIEIIEADPGSDVAQIADDQDVGPVRQFQQVSLFIDDVSMSCAQGGTCVVGDIGPGGGVVFYAPKWPFTSDVSDCVSTCRYLEAAPSDVGGNVPWDVAMATALDFSANGLADWYLPTKDDLNQLYVQRAKVGGFEKDYYWSSSETSPGSAYRQYFAGGQRSSASQTSAHLVRPVRAFG